MAIDFPKLPNPTLPSLIQSWNVLVTGIGGTGVLTVSAILVMAAHIEGKGCATMNQTCLTQKFGSIISHVCIDESQNDIHAVRIVAGDADLLLDIDLLVSASDDALAKPHLERSHAIINTDSAPTTDFISNPDTVFPIKDMEQTIIEKTGKEKTQFISATTIATELLGNSIATNIFLLGYAYQHGLIPVTAEAIERTITLNNVAIEFNRQAFLWGRRAAYDLQAVLAIAKIENKKESRQPTDLDDIVKHRMELLIRYQNKNYTNSYRKFVELVHEHEGSLHFRENELQLTKAMVRYLYKLMAYKDKYEVARLYSDGKFTKKLKEQFDGKYKLQFHLVEPYLSKRDEQGNLIKRTYPQITMLLFGALVKLKSLRGTRCDIFGYTQERKRERQLIDDYKSTILELLKGIDENNYKISVEITSLPKFIRGFGHIKQKSIKEFEYKQAVPLDKFYHRDKKSIGWCARQRNLSHSSFSVLFAEYHFKTFKLLMAQGNWF